MTGKFFRRAILYGIFVLVVWAGMRTHSSLSRRACEAEVSYEGFTVRVGALERKAIYDILLKSDSSPEEAFRISQALKEVTRVRKLLPEDQYRIVRSTGGQFYHLTLTHGLKRYVVAGRNEGFQASSHDIPISHKRYRRTGILRDNLWLSMKAEDVSPEVIASFSDVFRWSIDFLTEPRGGDRFALIWTEDRTPEDRLLNYTIQAALYEGTETDQHVAIEFEGEYYNKRGESLRRMFLRAPLQFSHISSYFSKSRHHPILRRYRPHHGIDYVAPRGTPAVSVAAGTVIFAGRDGGFGNVVVIRHNDAYRTRYAHLSRFAKRVRKGAKVKQKQVIGFVGSTGLATGAHLHFELEKNGRPENFLKLNLPFARSLPRRSLGKFKKIRDLRLAELETPLVSSGKMLLSVSGK